MRHYTPWGSRVVYERRRLLVAHLAARPGAAGGRLEVHWTPSWRAQQARDLARVAVHLARAARGPALILARAGVVAVRAAWRDSQPSDPGPAGRWECLGTRCDPPCGWHDELDPGGECPECGAAADFVVMCRSCGCTEERGCLAGCWWVEEDLCSRCAPDRGQVPVGMGDFLRDAGGEDVPF